MTTTARLATSGTPLSPLPARDQRSASLAHQAYEAMNGGATGWGTDQAKLFEALESPELAAIRRDYQAHYQRSFDGDVRGELSGLGRARADALLAGDRGLADATRLYQAMKGGTGAGTDEASVFAALEGKDAGQLEAITRAYQGRFGDLAADLGRELTDPDDAARARALLAGDRAGADAAKLHQAMKGGLTGAGTDQAAVLDTLERGTDAERGALSAAYGKMYGAGPDDAALRRDLSGELSSATRDRALALVSGDRAGADAAKLRDAMRGGWTGIGTDTRAIHDTFEGKSEGERRAVVEAYDKKYGAGALSRGLSRELGASDLAKTQALMERGQLSGAEAVHFAVAGNGTDEAALTGALRGKSKAELDRMSAEYQEKYGRPMREAIAGDVGGRLAFDTTQMQAGRPETAEDLVKQLEAARAYERSGLVNGASRAFMDAVAPEKGATLDRNTDRARALVRDAAVAERPLSGAEKAELSRLGGWAEQDVASYRTAKDSAGEAAGTAAATLATTAVVAGTGGTATPGVIARAGLAGGGANVASQAAIGGAGYGAGDALTDGVVGAVDGATAVTGPGAAVARRAVQSSATRALAQGGVREASAEVVEVAG